MKIRKKQITKYEKYSNHKKTRNLYNPYTVFNCKEPKMPSLTMKGESVMGVYVAVGIIGAYIVLSLLLVPVQYKYIKQLNETQKRNKERGVSVEDHYDQMSFETQQLHFNAQGNLLFIGANLLATLVYNLKSNGKK